MTNFKTHAMDKINLNKQCKNVKNLLLKLKNENLMIIRNGKQLVILNDQKISHTEKWMEIGGLQR